MHRESADRPLPEPVALDAAHVGEIYRVVNDAAAAYRGVIPADCFHEPYMPLDELRAELTTIRFHGAFMDGRLVGVMGVQDVQDVTLIRHAYVETAWRRRGIGSTLLRHVERVAAHPTILIGTWAAAWWALDFYARHGYTLVADAAAKDALLHCYWTVPDRQIATSVVLRKAR